MANATLPVGALDLTTAEKVLRLRRPGARPGATDGA